MRQTPSKSWGRGERRDWMQMPRLLYGNDIFQEYYASKKSWHEARSDITHQNPGMSETSHPGSSSPQNPTADTGHYISLPSFLLETSRSAFSWVRKSNKAQVLHFLARTGMKSILPLLQQHSSSEHPFPPGAWGWPWGLSSRKESTPVARCAEA